MEFKVFFETVTYTQVAGAFPIVIILNYLPNKAI